MEKSRKPKIRFKGYNDDWEQRKLGEIVSIIMGQSPDGSTYSNEPSDYILVQGNADLLNGWVLPRIWTTQITKKADAGDLIMSVRAPAGSMGKTAYDAVIGRGVAAIKGNEFIYQLLVKMDEEGYWKTFSCGSTFESLSSDTIKNAEVCITLSAEQMQIGLFLKQLDSLITLHQRKLEKLMNVKKSMLEKMFPKQGSVVPEIRFCGFTDAWEQRELGELILEYKKTVDSSCTLPVLTSSKTEGVILQEEHFGRKQQHDITGYNVLPRSFCTYRNRSDGVDFTFNVNECCDMGIISKFYPVFYGNDNDTFFLSLVLNNSDEVVHEIAFTCIGTGQKVLSFLDLQKMSIRVPKQSEQKKISTYFKQLDDLITLHQRKLEKLKNIKKSMLEKMFI